MIAMQMLSRRRLLRDATVLAAGLVLPAILSRPARAQTHSLAGILAEAERLSPLRTIVIARNGEMLAERGFRGHSPSAPTNIKSASKPIIGALVGMAIARGLLEGIDQPIAPILRADIPAGADPRIEAVTIGHLLTMQAGLQPTSGAQYGRWVGSGNWVRTALAQPFVDEPGAGMLYSTGSTHLLSAILTRVTGRSTLENAREWLAPLEGFSIAGWERDPQGIYLGGNEMAMSARSLLAFGEMYRNNGRSRDGQVLSPDWIARSWSAHTRSIWSGEGYGYGWFLRNMGGEDISYAWGYGGQMLYVAPRLGLSVVMTSDDAPRDTTIADRDNLHALSNRIIEMMLAG
jgi:CubicO group peptidase (beta-lactamase class C family)